MAQPPLQVAWFKRDLRIHDHAQLAPTLQTGCAQSYPQIFTFHSYPRALCITVLVSAW